MPDPRLPGVETRVPGISGFVMYDREAGTPLGVIIRLESKTGLLVDQAWTGSSGRFEFYRIPQGIYFLVVNHRGYKPVRMQLEYFAPIGGVLITLVPEDPEKGAVAGASVSVRELTIPRKALAEYQKGMEALAKKKPEEAAAHLRKAIQLYPEFDEACLQLGWLYLEQRSYREAQQALQKTIALNEKNARAHALLGSIYRQENQLPQALEALQRSVSLDENLWFAHMELGRTLLRLRRIEEAFGHISRAHQLNAGAPSVHILLYDAYVLRNDYKSAVAELEEFLRLFPGNPMTARIRQQHEALSKIVGEQKP